MQEKGIKYLIIKEEMIMNNIEEFYERKELFGTVKDINKNSHLFYATTQGENNEGKIGFFDDIKNRITKEKKQDIMEMIVNKITGYKEEIEKYIINRLKESMECSREEIKKDFNIKEEI